MNDLDDTDLAPGLNLTESDRDKAGPRDHPNYRARGPNRWSFTVEDIARAAGLTVSAVRKAKSCRRRSARRAARAARDSRGGVDYRAFQLTVR